MSGAGSRGADALVRALHASGTRRIFTLSGNHIMPVFDAALDAGIALVHTRHEAATVHMADAWARITGEAGVALVTGGPGHANAVAALYTAAMAESPLVLISGHAPTSQIGKGAFQEMRQADIAAPLVKRAWTCESAARLGADALEALRIARAGRPGPVHLSVPVDLLEERGDFPLVQAGDDRPHGLAEGDARNLLTELGRAKRPLILCGPACTTKTGRGRMAALESASGIPVVGMESPRGISDPSLGAFAFVLREADAILLLGKRLDFTLQFGRAPAIDAQCRFLQVDAEPAEIERTRAAVGDRLAAAMQADAIAAIDTLARLATKTSASAWCDEVRSAIAHRPASWDRASASVSGRLHPVEALRPLQSLLEEEDAVFVSDGGEFGQWAQACLSAPHRVINGVAGAIGAALPFALAARLACPQAPVIAALGDGTFGFHAAEIETAARHRLAFLAVVGNDARWNAEYQIQLREYGRERAVGCELLPIRYDAVARAFGGHGEHVADAAALLPAARRALASGLPAVLDVAIEGVAAPLPEGPASVRGG